MKAPCHGCERRTVSPNCHDACEAYKAFKAANDALNDLRRKHYLGINARIEQSQRRKDMYYKKRRT